MRGVAEDPDADVGEEVVSRGRDGGFGGHGVDAPGVEVLGE